MTNHRATLEALHAKAGGNFNTADKDEKAAALAAVFGPENPDEAYRRFLAEYEKLWADGCRLAELVVTYGWQMVPNTPLVRAALAVAQPFAEQLLVRRAAEAQRVAAGGVGSVAYFSTYTGGDLAAAKRLYAEARANEVLR